MNLSLQKALALQKRDRLIIRQVLRPHKIGDEYRRLSYAEVGRMHGLTRERVRQIVKAANGGA